MGGRYKGYLVCSWRVGSNEKAKDVFEGFKALKQEEWIWVASKPWMVGEVKIGYETNIVFKDQKIRPLNLATRDDDFRLFDEIGDLQQAKARLISLSTETKGPHLIEETGEWFEGGSVDIEFEICEEGRA